MADIMGDEIEQRGGRSARMQVMEDGGQTARGNGERQALVRALLYAERLRLPLITGDRLPQRVAPKSEGRTDER
jgi:hypothetical protein